MANFYPLAFSGKDDLMIARHGSTTQRGKANCSGRAWPRNAIAPALAMIGQHDAATARCGLSQQQRRAGRRIDLVAVMHLDNFDVPVLTQARRRLFHKRREQVDAKRGVASLEHGDIRRRLVDQGVVGRLKTGRANQDGLMRRGAGLEMGRQGSGRGKVDEDVGSRSQCERIV